jgi:hypothetical protein
MLAGSEPILTARSAQYSAIVGSGITGPLNGNRRSGNRSREPGFDRAGHHRGEGGAWRSRAAKRATFWRARPKLLLASIDLNAEAAAIKAWVIVNGRLVWGDKRRSAGHHRQAEKSSRSTDSSTSRSQRWQRWAPPRDADSAPTGRRQFV